MDFTKTTAPKRDGCSINQLEKRQTVGLYSPGQYTVQHHCTGSYFTRVGVRPLLLQVYITVCDVQTRGHSNMHAGIVLGLLTTVLVLDPPKLACRACKLDLATELLHEELHHPLRTLHWVFGLHVDVSEKSF